MGLRDLFRRRPPSGEWVDPSTVDPDEALRRAQEGLAETDSYIDEHGNRRKLPPGAKDPVAEALEQARQSLGNGAGGERQ
jgi:hypothetical protein